MRFGKRREKETVVSISEITTIESVYYDADDKEIINYGGSWSICGLTYSRMGYKKVKKYRVDSMKYYNSGHPCSLFTSLFLNKEEAEEIYNELLNLNGEKYIETLIDKITFKK